MGMVMFIHFFIQVGYLKLKYGMYTNFPLIKYLPLSGFFNLYFPLSHIEKFPTSGWCSQDKVYSVFFFFLILFYSLSSITEH